MYWFVFSRLATCYVSALMSLPVRFWLRQRQQGAHGAVAMQRVVSLRHRCKYSQKQRGEDCSSLPLLQINMASTMSWEKKGDPGIETWSDGPKPTILGNYTNRPDYRIQHALSE